MENMPLGGSQPSKCPGVRAAVELWDSCTAAARLDCTVIDAMHPVYARARTCTYTCARVNVVVEPLPFFSAYVHKTSP